MATTENKIYNLLNNKQREFVGYVLRKYIEVGVDDLDISNLSTLLAARYENLDTATEELGEVAGFQEIFISIQ